MSDLKTIISEADDLAKLEKVGNHAGITDALLGLDPNNGVTWQPLYPNVFVEWCMDAGLWTTLNAIVKRPVTDDTLMLQARAQTVLDMKYGCVRYLDVRLDSYNGMCQAFVDAKILTDVQKDAAIALGYRPALRWEALGLEHAPTTDEISLALRDK